MKFSGMFCDVGSVEIVGFGAGVTVSIKIHRIAPGAGVPIATMAFHPPLVGVTWIEAIYMYPGLVAVSTEIVPGAARIPPLDRVIARSIDFGPLESSGGLSDVVGVIPIRHIAWDILRTFRHVFRSIGAFRRSIGVMTIRIGFQVTLEECDQ
jgi:hypothetical protein